MQPSTTGYKPNSTIYKLHFESPHLLGLEVKARSTTMAKLRKVMETNVDTKDIETYHDVFKFFAGRIVEWNVLHPEIEEPTIEGKCPYCGLTEDTIMPVNFQSVMCLDPDMVIQIIRAWIVAVTSVELPKEINTRAGNETEHLLNMMTTESLPIPPHLKLDGQN
jgi:hypothetical protein